MQGNNVFAFLAAMKTIDHFYRLIQPIALVQNHPKKDSYSQVWSWWVLSVNGSHTRSQTLAQQIREHDLFLRHFTLPNLFHLWKNPFVFSLLMLWPAWWSIQCAKNNFNFRIQNWACSMTQMRMPQQIFDFSLHISSPKACAPSVTCMTFMLKFILLLLQWSSKLT